MGSSESDWDGRVRIPDCDCMYAFTLEKDPYVLNEPEAWFDLPPRLVTYLNKPETTLKMHRWRRRQLEMEVTTDGDPTPGLIVGGCLTGCPCGACCGPLAGRSFEKKAKMATDANGNFQMMDFYPEEFERVFLPNAADKEVWSEDPRKWPPQESSTSSCTSESWTTFFYSLSGLFECFSRRNASKVALADRTPFSGSQSQKLSQASDFFYGSHPPVVRKVRRLSRKYGEFPASVVGFRLTGLRQCGYPAA